MKFFLATILSLAATPVFAAVSLTASGFFEFIIYLLIVGVVFGILLFLVGKAPFIPEPFKQIIVWVIYIVGAIFLINLLLGLVGSPMFSFR